jgi:hypothetical protein
MGEEKELEGISKEQNRRICRDKRPEKGIETHNESNSEVKEDANTKNKQAGPRSSQNKQRKQTFINDN